MMDGRLCKEREEGYGVAAVRGGSRVLLQGPSRGTSRRRKAASSKHGGGVASSPPGVTATSPAGGGGLERQGGGEETIIIAEGKASTGEGTWVSWPV